VPKCLLCQTPLGKTRERTLGQELLTLFSLVLSIALCLTCGGAILGVPLLIWTLKYGTTKTWKCPACGWRAG